MWRVLLVIVAMLVIADATGMLSQCDDTCEDEQAGKQCPPTCPTCACSPHTVASAPAPAQVELAVVLDALVIEHPAPEIAYSLAGPSPVFRPPIA